MENKHYTIEMQGGLGHAVSFGLAELKRTLHEAGWAEGEGTVITLEQKDSGSPELFLHYSARPFSAGPGGCR